ncbi:carboxylate-amine ligase [Desulfofustis limnaeus]|nr:YbdK family carboxylate-amine ligase [Desulfofustis limnaeus]MDX9896480.1 YbdK family carboxylate-amine ligase [Desulfofustis sp.]
MTGDFFSFHQGSRFTIGVEIEFQIIDANDCSLVPLGPHLLNLAPLLLRPRLALELIKSMLEIQTGICHDVRDVENDLLQTCSLAEELAADNGCLLYAASLHPFARAASQELTDDTRFARIMDELQVIGRRFISQGLHVHIGLPDGDTAIRVCNEIQAFLPVFLALSTSSPFFQAKDTGFMSYRTKLFEVLPMAGIYDFLPDWRSFVAELDNLRRHGIIETIHDLWWDARPNGTLGTVEIRICDLPTRFSDILAIVALIQATVAWLADSCPEARPLRGTLLRANKWQAARYGLEGRFVDPTGKLGSHAMNLRLAAMLLKRKVSELADQLHSATYLEHLDSIISGGTGADLQRRVYHKSGQFKEVIRTVQNGFWK